MERPSRKDIRLGGFDYSRDGAYFVTVCTKNKMCIFWENNDKYKPFTAANNNDENEPQNNGSMPKQNKNADKKINSQINSQMDSQSVGAHSMRPPNVSHKIRLSEFGWAVKHSFQIVSDHYPMVFFDKYVIMPNHIHMIIRISKKNSYYDLENGRTECAPTVSQIIKNFKENVTREIGFSVWQKSFHDRILRNEYEYNGAWQYIENNPSNWENDELFIDENIKKE